MGLFQPSNRQLKPHTHAAGERLPLVRPADPAWQVRGDRPAHRGQGARAARRGAAPPDGGVRAEAQPWSPRPDGARAGASRGGGGRRAEGARRQGRGVWTAEAAMLARLAEIQSRLAQAEQAKAAAHEQMAALKAAQEAAVEKRVAEIQEALRQERTCSGEKDAAVLAEKAKVLSCSAGTAGHAAQAREASRRTSSARAPRSTCSSSCAMPSQGDRIQRVGKGVNGADVIHEVVHNGKVCGKIIYDAKNRNAWQNEFVTKLQRRQDRAGGGPRHPLQQQVPQGQRSQMHYQDGVIVANPARVLAIVRDPARPDRAHARAAHQQGGARAEDGRRSTPSSPPSTASSWSTRSRRRPARCWSSTAKEQEAHRRIWDQREQAHPLGAEGAQRPRLRDRPHHRHRRQRAGGRGGVALSSGALSSRAERISRRPRSQQSRRPGSRIFRFAKFRDDNVSRSSPPRGWRRCSRRTCRP